MEEESILNSIIDRIQSPSLGVSSRNLANSSQSEYESSGEEADVFIGPAAVRLLDCENPPERMAGFKGVDKLLRRDLGRDVCRYFVSPTGCQRVNCHWKHVNPGLLDVDINARSSMETDSSSLQRGKFGTTHTLNNYSVKMKELQYKNSELVRKNMELENEILDLRSWTKDIEFLREDNFKMKMLLERYESNHRIKPIRRKLRSGDLHRSCRPRWGSSLPWGSALRYTSSEDQGLARRSAV